MITSYSFTVNKCKWTVYVNIKNIMELNKTIIIVSLTINSINKKRTYIKYCSFTRHYPDAHRTFNNGHFGTHFRKHPFFLYKESWGIFYWFMFLCDDKRSVKKNWLEKKSSIQPKNIIPIVYTHVLKYFIKF